MTHISITPLARFLLETAPGDPGGTFSNYFKTGRATVEKIPNISTKQFLKSVKITEVTEMYLWKYRDLDSHWLKYTIDQTCENISLKSEEYRDLEYS